MVHSFEDGFDVRVCCVESWIACLTWHLALVHSLWQWKGGAHSLPRVRLFLTSSIFPAVFIPVYTTQVQLRLVVFLIMCLCVSLCVGMYMCVGTQRGQRCQVPWNEELQVVVNYLMEVLVIELGSSGKAVHALNG